MVYYAMSIVAGAIYVLLYLDRKNRPGKSYFLLGAFLLFLFGFFQRNFLPVEAALVRFLPGILRFLLRIAPYTLGLFSVVAIFHSGSRLHRRGWSRKYAAVLFGGTTLLLALALVLVNRLWYQLEWLYIVEFMVKYLFLYLIATFLTFLFLAFLYRFVRPHTGKDYIIVLGTGILPDGSLSPLLKNRLDEALRYYQLQEKLGRKRPTIIVSGGKGIDEPFSEAEVMRRYLLCKSIPPECILVEDRSINTHQNFLYSKELIEQRGRGRDTVFITNNFHVLRSGLYARKVGVRAEGIGARTSLYYLPYALAREYIAVILLHWQFHLVASFLFLALALWLRLTR